VPTVKDGFRDFWANASITGFWSKLLDAPNGHVITWIHNPPLATSLTLVSMLLVTAVAARKCWLAETTASRDTAFATCVVALLLVSPITWDHYFLLLVLTWAILWYRLPATWWNRSTLAIMVFSLFTIRLDWIFKPVIPGPGELVYFGDAEPSVALPIHALTVLAFQFYMLVALFLYACFRRPSDDTG
jgi:hypothetical protein